MRGTTCGWLEQQPLPHAQVLLLLLLQLRLC
jgi:hypothetical protein